MRENLESFNAALRQFSSTDEDSQGKGFSKLVERSRPFLHSLLLKSLSSEQDREDVIQEVFHRVWRSRSRLEFMTVGKWWQCLRVMARNCAVDHVRSQNSSVNMDDPVFQEIPDLESDQIEALVEFLEDRRALYRLADEAFLELPQDYSEKVRSRQLLAAKLFYVDRLPWTAVCRIVNSNANDADLIGRAELDRLLSDLSIIRQLIYSELHWENNELCDYLLGLESRKTRMPIELQTKWSEDETLAIQLRFLHIMLLEQISTRMSSQFKKTHLVTIFDSCVRRFPFVEIMNRLNKDLGAVRGAHAEFVASGLWHRLMFQYFCHNSLTHQDIYDRTAQAAQVAGYEITLGKLNVGLSNGRLFKKLADHLERKKRDGNR